MFVAIYDALTTDHPRLRARIWWERRRALVIVAAIAAIAIWLPLTTAFFTRPLVEPLRYDLTAAFISPAVGLHHRMHALITILSFFEFAILILPIPRPTTII